MFAPISAIFSLLFFASTLPNGIRLVELPAEGDSVEIIAGYTSGGLTGFASTADAKSLLFDAYAAGSAITFIEELDRTAFRIAAPKWAVPIVTSHLPALFKEVPKGAEGPAPSAPSDFRAKVEDEIRNAILGPSVPALDYATADAFIVISGTAPNTLRDALAAIPKRGSTTKPGQETISRLPAERTLRFRSELPEGAVIFASPIPGAYYNQWFLVLLLDRLIHRIVPIRVKTTLPLTVHPHYYRIEVVVPSGQFPEPAEENLLQELQRLQFVRAPARDLTAARQEALAYLDSKPVREWFASHDILAQREEGMRWIESMSADDMRVAARDLLIMNRVIASWAPKPKQTSVSSESLSPAGSVSDRPGRSQSAPAGNQGPMAGLPLLAFPAHTHSAFSTSLPERLASAVWIAASTTNAVFISGGSMTRFDRELTADDLKPFQQYRSDRILVLSPASSLDRARQLWTTFKGSTTGETRASRGKVSSGDLPALFVLKAILDLKVIESGWWPEVSLRLEAGEGSMLQIHATDEQRAQIFDWIKAIASAPLPDAYFAWAHEVAMHRFDSIQADLQALTWERDPQGMIPDLEAVSPKHVQDVARIYF